jgi:hypothetical protein
MLATLGGYAYMLTLAFTPLALGIGNTLGGCASNWHPSIPVLTTRIDMVFDSANMVFDAADDMVFDAAADMVFDSADMVFDSVDMVFDAADDMVFAAAADMIFEFAINIAYSKHSTTTSPTTSLRQHHLHDSATKRLHRPRHARALFGALTRDIQEYDVKENLGLESLP